MKKFLIGLFIGISISSAVAGWINITNSSRTQIQGKDCIVVETKNGVGISCNWN